MSVSIRMKNKAIVEASLKFEGTVKQTQAFKPDLTKMILMESVERISIWKS